MTLVGFSALLGVIHRIRGELQGRMSRMLPSHVDYTVCEVLGRIYCNISLTMSQPRPRFKLSGEYTFFS
jgi:hypothetical protein